MVIDFHAHVGSMESVGMVGDQAEMLHVMDQAGVDIACVFNLFHSDAAFGNQVTAQFVAAYPDRFIGFAFATPFYPEEMESALRQAVDELGLKGIKIYPPWFTRPVDDDVWEPIFAFAHARKLPIISHTDGDDPIVGVNRCEPLMFARWAQKYPQAKIVLGHAGNFPSGRRSCVLAAQKCPNIYIEICSSWRQFGSIEELVEGAGEDRVLFGSDMALMDPRIHMGRVLTARISEEGQQKILGGNAARLLGIHPRTAA